MAKRIINLMSYKNRLINCGHRPRNDRERSELFVINLFVLLKRGMIMDQCLISFCIMTHSTFGLRARLSQYLIVMSG